MEKRRCYLDRRETVLLIELYRMNPCLWDVKTEEYKDRNKRVAAINVITEELKKSGLSVNTLEVKRKIETIRSQYRRELRKLEKSKKCGGGSGESYTPTLWCFHELCFLKDGDCIRKTLPNMDSQASNDMAKEIIDHEIIDDPLALQAEDSPATPTTPPPDTPAPSASTSRVNVRYAPLEPSPAVPHQRKEPEKGPLDTTASQEILQEVLHQLRSLSRAEEVRNDSESDFGNVVANDLRRMNEETKIRAQKLISDVLFLGRLGKISSSTSIVE